MRGKHASSAEATRAREGAISEAESLRRQVAKLTKERDSLAETLASEREVHTSTTRALNGMLADVTTPEIVALRQRAEEAERVAADAVHEVGMRVRKAFGNSQDFMGNANLHLAISDALGLTVAEFLQLEEDGTRRQRRASRDQVRVAITHGLSARERQTLANKGLTADQDFARGVVAGFLE